MNRVDTLVRSPALTAFLDDVARTARAEQLQQPGSRDALMTTVMVVDDLHAKLLAFDARQIPAFEVYASAVELAARAAQLALEGSAEFTYAFDMAHHANFNPTRGEA